MTDFIYSPSRYVPFRDQEALERCRKIKREEIEHHPNPDFKIRVVKDDDIEFIWVTDMFHRIKAAADAGQRIILILPNPCPVYRHVARLINRFRVNCRHLYAFAMDEYANEDGVIAPETWPQGFVHAMKRYFYAQIEEDLRPPEAQFIGPTNQNYRHYGKMIADLGGGDACYTGPGWTGHLAFIEPDAPEFRAASLEEWMTFGPRVRRRRNLAPHPFGDPGKARTGLCVLPACRGAGNAHWTTDVRGLAGRDIRGIRTGREGAGT